jgi:hypothetical protein
MRHFAEPSAANGHRMLGKNGNRLAWETKRWQTIEAFHATQRKKAVWEWIRTPILILFVIGVASGSGSSSSG